MKILRKLLWLFLLLFLITCALSLVYYHAVTKDAVLSPEKLQFTEKSVVVYDRENVPVNNISGFWKQTVSAKDIPLHTKQAFIDTEDKRFLKHNGFDYKRILRAMANNAKSRSFKEGASTISQQLIKNTHLTQEKTLKRKLKEWKLTKALEKKYTKDEILEKYLNTIYFGHGCFGISSAAEFYFGKQVKDLSVADSAILAGLIKSPNNYSPFKSPEKCQKRKATVLALMQKNGSISEAEKQVATSEPLPVQQKQSARGGYLHFVFEEFTELADVYDLQIGGKIEIKTYLDTSVQAEIEKLASGVEGCGKAVMVMDNESGGFKGAFSDVGNAKRLPGSIIKPLLVYAPALEENILSPATPILDEKVNYGGYSPENYDRQYHGYVSARECVEKSLNVPAVKTLSALGTKKAVEYLDKMDLHVEADDHSLALALGGMKKGFSLQELTQAYSTLASSGVFKKGSFINELKINGKTVYKKQAAPRRVFSDESAYLMTDILKSTAEKGTAKKLRGLPFEIAAKTGTVGTDSGNTDAYAISYTTKDSVAVWLGNADNSCIPFTGGGEPCNLLRSLNESLYELYQKRTVTISPFARPKEVVCVTLDRASYYDTHTLSLADELSPITEQISELFKKSAIPLNKSDSYSNPSIQSPRLEVVDGKVYIQFDERCPRHYTYKIERSDYVTHRTLYEGEFLSCFEDSSLEKGKRYQYSITPIYKDRVGQAIQLPSVSLDSGQSPSWEDNAILDKSWWDY